MGCGSTKEGIESEMMALRLYRIEIKDERKKMIAQLERLTGKKMKRFKVPDYIHHEILKTCRSERCCKTKVIRMMPENKTQSTSKELSPRLAMIAVNRRERSDRSKEQCSIGDVSEIDTVLQTVH